MLVCVRARCATTNPSHSATPVPLRHSADEKKDNPETAKGIVVAMGNFHPHAHYMCCCITGWWWCVCCCFAEQLGLKKVTHVMKDLEHNNFTHAFTFLVSSLVKPLYLT